VLPAAIGRDDGAGVRKCYLWCVVAAALMQPCRNLQAQMWTEGSARLEVTLLDYNGSGAKHYTVVWVTTEAGQFIKSLRKQGPSSWTSKQWNDHCRQWNNARAGSMALDGYTSATATTYSGTNSPVICIWDGRDAANQVVPDGKYKFWVQYAEDSGQGPYTTNGLLWTKGQSAATTTYPDQGANFAAMRVTWTPSAPPAVAPSITSAPPSSGATVGVPYAFACAATGTAPIVFSAQGLPAGLAMSPEGLISGIPTAAGSFTGTIVAANGVTPDATQAFTITVEVVLTTLAASYRVGQMVLTGSGPPLGRYAVLASADLGSPLSQWALIGEGAFAANGSFGFTNTIPLGESRWFYSLRVP
jgi:hypothetical protein